MSRTQRILLMALAAAFAATVLAWRIASLDVAGLLAQAGERAGMQVEMQRASWVWFPRPGIRLEAARLERPGIRIEADALFVHASLVPFMFGKIELDTLAFQGMRLDIARDAAWRGSVGSLARLPLSRISVSRGSLRVAGKPWLNDFTLDVRDIGINRDTLWEFQALIDGHLMRSYGRLSFRQGRIVNSFGKLKFEQVPLARWREFFPGLLRAGLHGDEAFSGSATFNMNGRENWTLFGEGRLQRADAMLLRFRGKLEHPRQGRLLWHDAFVHIGRHAIIGLNGGCGLRACNTRVDGRSLPPDWFRAVWAEQARKPTRIDGEARLDAAIHWHATAWRATASLQTRGALFHFGADTIAWPNVEAEIGRLDGEGMRWRLASATLRVAGEDDRLDVAASYDPAQGLAGDVRSDKGVTRAWVPLGNLILASRAVPGRLAGHGRLSGAFHLQQRDDGYRLRLDLDASAAQFSYGSWRKPQHMAAVCQWSLANMASERSWSLKDCRLGGSGVAALRWWRKDGRQGVEVREGALDFGQISELLGLQAESRWHGRMDGDFVAEAPLHADWDDWLQGAAGELDLHGFGRDGWHVDGHVAVGHGRLSSSHVFVQWQGGHANLGGEYDAARRRAQLHVLSAQADPLDLEKFAAWIGGERVLAGTLRGVVLRHGDWEWRNVQGALEWSHRRLRLSRWQASWHEAPVSGNELRLQPENGTIRIAGDLRVSALPVERAPELLAWLGQPTLHGSLSARLKFAGSWPPAHWSDWRVDGDVDLRDGSWQSPQLSQGTAWTFSALSGQLHVDESGAVLERLVFRRGLKRMNGRVRIAPDGAIDGELSGGAGCLSIGGAWPVPQWRQSEGR